MLFEIPDSLSSKLTRPQTQFLSRLSKTLKRYGDPLKKGEPLFSLVGTSDRGEALETSIYDGDFVITVYQDGSSYMEETFENTRGGVTDADEDFDTLDDLFEELLDCLDQRVKGSAMREGS